MDIENREFDNLDSQRVPVPEDAFLRVEQIHALSAERKKLCESVVDQIDGVAQTEFEKDRSAMAGLVNRYADAVATRNERVDIARAEAQIDELSDEDFDTLVNELTARILGVSEALMRKNDPAAFSPARLETEIKHHKEVIGLAMKLVQGTNLSKSDKLRTILAAAVHDMAKYARRADSEGNLRSFGIDKGDNFFSLFNHEVLSARTAAELGNTSIFSDIKIGNQSITLPEGYAEVIAGTAAGHGRGEFPEKMARLGAFRAFGAEPDYYMVRLPDDSAAVVVHLSDAIQGQFGHNSSGWGESWVKYNLAMMNKTLEESIEGKESTMMTNIENYTEVLFTLDSSGNISEEIRETCRKEALQQASAATAFSEFVRGLGKGDPDVAIMNVVPGNAEDRVPAFKRLLKRAEEAGVFSDEKVASAQERFLAMYKQKVSEILQNCEGQLLLAAAAPGVYEALGYASEMTAEMAGYWNTAKYHFLQRKIAFLKRLQETL
ncbi:hypothetical protein COU77_02900 [Candidatus Peregrinibacteria bacterium CG10_big_fil_rev_8_21_14_0_10_49_16]|nr:MAG: hypothetical protein COW95_02415 [Candidatus Peregrinibacteria bacterium CG22_combo_CG10-13_8_21_14_all_49_11]PIR51984.1 MAG: hypothetical protein COU77_02900 [Candidatus Peregrinibacteria bacterium CG10_big_fil_rev_8_21_14_0_10_49_16]